jgi:hypothetical protein
MNICVQILRYFLLLCTFLWRSWNMSYMRPQNGPMSLYVLSYMRPQNGPMTLYYCLIWGLRTVQWPCTIVLYEASERSNDLVRIVLYEVPERSNDLVRIVCTEWFYKRSLANMSPLISTNDILRVTIRATSRVFSDWRFEDTVAFWRLTYLQELLHKIHLICSFLRNLCFPCIISKPDLLKIECMWRRTFETYL